MSQSTSPKKRKLATVLVPLATPKRAKSSVNSKKDVAVTPLEAPLSAASDRTFLTARSSPELDQTAFKTPMANPMEKSVKLSRQERRSLRQSLADESNDGAAAQNTVTAAATDKVSNVGGALIKVDTEDVTGKTKRGKARRRRSQKNTSTEALIEREGTEVSVGRNGWALTKPVGGTFLKQDPIFVRDATNRDFLVVATSREVQLLSIQTSLVERVSEAEDGLEIRAVAASPTATDVVYILYGNGAIFAWNLVGKQTSRRAGVKGSKTLHFAISPGKTSGEDEIYTVSSGSDGTEICLNDQSVYTTRHEIHEIQVIGRSDYVVAYSDSSLLLGRRSSNSDAEDRASRFIWVELPSASRIDCLAATEINRSESSKSPHLSVVYGTNEGKLHLYEDLSSLFSIKRKVSLPDPRILHWHRGPVGSVKFSRDCNYLISGGGETVLVLWQLSTGNTQFLPHLTSNINRLAISHSGDRYAVLLDDNSVLVLSTSELKPVANFAGLQLAATASIATPVPAVIDPIKRDQLLLLVPSSQPVHESNRADNARPFLQTFNMRDVKHVARQALSRNNITDINIGPERNPIVPPDATSLRLSIDGQWLATMDDWLPPVSDMEPLVPQKNILLEIEHARRRESHLKLWNWNDEIKLWVLSTRFDGPHDKGRSDSRNAEQTCLISDPANVGFASLGGDDCIRIWRPKVRLRHGEVIKADGTSNAVQWSCRHVVELPLAARRADSPMGIVEREKTKNTSCLAWSNDGSMLVAAQVSHETDEAPILHFVDVATGTLITKAAIAPNGLVALAFCERYLIALGSLSLNLWDVVEDKLVYSVRIYTLFTTPPMLAVDRQGKNFAVAVDERIILFAPSQPQSICEFKLGTNVVGLIAGETGYVVLYADGTFSSVVPTGDGDSRPRSTQTEKLQSITAQTSDEADANSKFVSTLDDMPETHLVAEASMDLDRNDRRVVRSEQLAGIFETQESFAMLSVRDMFHAVVDLYGRKPDA